MDLQGKRVALLVENFYEDLELWYPKLRLQEAGAEVMIIGVESTTYHSKHGYPARVEQTISQAPVEDFDAVIIPGGYAPDYMRRHPAMIELVRQAWRQDKVVAAICHAAWMLISAEVVRGKHLTCFFSLKDDVINAGGHYEDREVVRDGNLITSRQPDDLPAFCSTIITTLSEASVAAPASAS